MFTMDNIKEKSIEFEDGERPYIDIKFIPDPDQNTTMLGYDYEITMVDERELHIQFTFENAEYVSQSTTED